MKRAVPSIRYAGYSLIEMALVLILLAAFTVVANKLLMSTFMVKRDAISAGDDLLRTEDLIRLIRSDVWGASAIHSDSPEQVTIELPDGAIIRWQLGDTLDEDETESYAFRTELIEGHESVGNPLYAPPGLTILSDAAGLYLVAGSDTVRLISMFNLYGKTGP